MEPDTAQRTALQKDGGADARLVMQAGMLDFEDHTGNCHEIIPALNGDFSSDIIHASNPVRDFDSIYMPPTIHELPIDFRKIITIIESSKRFDYPLR